MARAEATVHVEHEVDAEKLKAQLVEAFAPMRAALFQMAEALTALGADLAKIAAELPRPELCAPDGSYHVTPHRGCILR